jgi:hypothetical protein
MQPYTINVPIKKYKENNYKIQHWIHSRIKG